MVAVLCIHVGCASLILFVAETVQALSLLWRHLGANYMFCETVGELQKGFNYMSRE